GAAHHDFVVTPARAVGVEIFRLHALLLQISAGGTVRHDRTGRGNMAGSDAVSHHHEAACFLDRFDGIDGSTDAFEEWWLAYVVGFRPRTQLALGDGECIPVFIAAVYVSVFAGKHGRIEVGGNAGLILSIAWPDDLQVHRLAIVADAQRFLIQVDIHRVCQCIGDYQWWRRQIVGPDLGVDAAFEV